MLYFNQLYHETPSHKKHNGIEEEEEYCDQVYEPIPENFNDLDEKHMKEKGLNILSSNQIEKKVKGQYNMSILVVKKVLEKVLVKLFKEASMVLKKFQDIYPHEHPNSFSPMFDI